MEHIDDLKHSDAESPTYHLKNATVYVSKSGYHYTRDLDPVEKISPEIDTTQLTSGAVAYIESQLQANSEKFENQARIVHEHLYPVDKKKILDIGCGGGLFLSKLKDKGADVLGIELSDKRAHYTMEKHDIDVVKRPIEDDFWKDHYSSFDAVSLWDVIEHVNYPEETLQYSVNMLKKGGYLFIDTPCRDSFYHRFGEFTYKMTNGKFPTFLNAMYSASPFGHKQIISTAEMKDIFEHAGLEVITLEKFHELSFPHEFYLKKLINSQTAIKLSLPIVRALLWLFPVKNKMLVIGRKK